MKKTILLLSSVFMLLALVSCSGYGKNNEKTKASLSKQKDNEMQMPSSYPVDENFETVKIGKQIWTAENLHVSIYRNGDPILQVQDEVKWNELESGAFCYYENNAANGAKYGKLYNWYAVNDPRGLAPQGWHIPSDAEWKQLVNYLGGENEASKKLKSNNNWNKCEGKSGNGNNSTGFAALPAGFRDFFGPFYAIGSNGLWWSSDEDGINNRNGIFRCMCYNYSNVFRNNFTKRRGLSVRCVKD